MALPNANRLVLPPSSQPLAVRGEDHPRDRSFVSLQFSDQFTSFRLPDPCRVIVTGGGDQPAVPTEGDPGHTSGVTQHPDWEVRIVRIGVSRPHTSGGVEIRGDNPAPVRTELHTVYPHTI